VASRLSKVKRGVYLLPSLFTTASIFCGFFSIIRSINSLNEPLTHFTDASWAIIIAFFFDGIDGRLARLTKTTSRFGIEYDSLSDLVSFGLAPALLMYVWGLKPYGRLGWLAAFLYFVCGALRLARFNSQTPGNAKRYFQGLPIPPAAGFIAITVILHEYLGGVGNTNHLYLIFMAYALAFLMVSRIGYRSFKDLSLTARQAFSWLIIAVLLLIVVALEPEIMLFTIGISYVSYFPLKALYVKLTKRQAKLSMGTENTENHQ
jgi:CDP-diacylglycerol--serine O-phosphatidyltransferase